MKETKKYEWILTNGKGGYTLGESDLINSRKYQSLLTASTEGLKRTNLVSSVEEKFEVMGETFFADSNRYPDTVYPGGSSFLEYSRLRPYPLFRYKFPNSRGQIAIRKEILMDEQENIVLLRYSNIGNLRLQFSFRYKLSLRDHHHVNQPGLFDYIPVEAEIALNDSYRIGYAKRIDNNAEVYIYAFSGSLVKEPVIYRNIFYEKEASRGYDSLEDLSAPFLHRGFINPNEQTDIILSDCKLTNSKVHSIRQKIIGRYTGKSEKVDYMSLLRDMLDDFKINRDIIAGYPWFSAWGRDTMISLEAFTCQKDKTDYVFSVLMSYGKELKNGILPNVKGEGGLGRNYDTVDASLWFVIRAHEVFENVNEEKKRTLFKYCKEILLNYAFNKNSSFSYDLGDGLISLNKDSGAALTWMDAKVDGVPVTPRYGKPIEINALWYNTVIIVTRMALKLGEKTISSSHYSINTEDLNKTGMLIKKSMKKFYNNGIWCDRIDDNMPVPEVRPNFVIACSLPFDFTDTKGLKNAYSTARDKLLTPYGLRTLSEDSPQFNGVYGGSQKVRDLAYHQGTVWAWLLLPYAKLLIKALDKTGEANEELERIVSAIKEKIMNGVYASIAEIWDGKEPEEPKGTPAQGWSVAALYCIEKIKRTTT